MKIEGSRTVPAVRDRAWALLQDPDVLARCMPGCEAMVKTGDDEYRMKMKMVLAAVSGQFDGTVRIANANPPESFRMIVEGAGKIGFMKGDGLLTLVPSDAATEIRYDGEVQVGGTIAAVGQRLLDTTAKMIIRKFFDRLSAACA